MSVMLSFALTCGFLLSPRAHVGHRQRSITRCPAIRVQTLFPDDPVRLNQPAADEEVVSVEFDEVDGDEYEYEYEYEEESPDAAATATNANSDGEYEYEEVYEYEEYEDAAVEVPPGAVVFDKARYEKYDFEAEARAAEGVVRVLTQLKRAGLDKEDSASWPALRSACDELARAARESPAPPIRDDPRLLGDWELVGSTSPDMQERKGMTGLGAAPFTNVKHIFYRFEPTGVVLAKEVLEFFGQPVIMNEMRGVYGFAPDGVMMQEKYTTADLGGMKDNKGFAGATATLRSLCVTADGAMRLASTPGGEAYFVFKKLPAGGLDSWLTERRLPVEGGTVVGQ